MVPVLTSPERCKEMSEEQKMMSKVAKLLERANHPNTPPEERESCLGMADRIMLKYALDMATIEASMSASERRKPIDKIYEGALVPDRNQTDQKKMFGALCRANGVRVVFLWNGEAHMFGLKENVTYVETVWPVLLFDYFANLRPSWDPQKDLDENVYRLCEASYKWREIADMATQYGHDIPWPDGGRLKRALHRYQKAHGLEVVPHRQSHATYLESFSMAYAGRVVARLYELEQERNSQSRGTGAELVLVNNQQDINDLVGSIYPKLRSTRDNRKLRNLAGVAAGVEAGNRARITKQESVAGNRKALS
jgi:hypothetical protein